MQPEILIVADDLSGAADCGIACRLHGLETVVLLDSESKHDIAAEALAIDANTRNMTPRKAALETGRVIRRHLSDPAQLLYKKLDSTLRGHIGAELAGSLSARRGLGDAGARSAVILLAPAFPATGRTTVAGQQMWGGVSLGYLPDLLDEAGLDSARLGLETGRLPARLAEAAHGRDVVVCDAVTDEDLMNIAAAGMSLDCPVVWAGSGGLARHLPRTRPRVRTGFTTDGPILIVVGSQSECARGQIAELAAAPGVSRVTVESIPAALDLGNDVLVTVDAGPDVKIKDAPELCAALAARLAPYLPHFGGLVLTGGETARAVLTAARVTALRLLDEVEPGVPLALATGPRVIPVVTKAGAFGDSRTLLRCRAALKITHA